MNVKPEAAAPNRKTWQNATDWALGPLRSTRPAQANATAPASRASEPSRKLWTVAGSSGPDSGRPPASPGVPAGVAEGPGAVRGCSAAAVTKAVTETAIHTV